MEFQIHRPFEPAGDQPKAIRALCDGLKKDRKSQVLMGVTGSGKTFTMANVIQELQRPALVISHNKTLAAQLYSEFRDFFPNNAVHYFVSYYDYYQPEAYIPQRDIYIEKDASINEEIDRLRLASTSSLVSRRDVIIVASVSSIYGLGSPDDYKEMMVALQRGQEIDRDEMLMKLIDIQYERNDVSFERGKFRVRGDCVEIWPSYEEYAFRIELWGDEIDKLSLVNPTSGEAFSEEEQLFVYPAKHFVMPEDRIVAAIDSIKAELADQLQHFREEGKLLEAQRLNARTRFDIEMMQEIGRCPGIENYSQPLSGRKSGEPPYTLYSFFPKDFLLFVDESHVTVPQIRAMYAGDRSRKSTLVEHGLAIHHKKLSSFRATSASLPQGHHRAAAVHLMLTTPWRGRECCRIGKKRKNAAVIWWKRMRLPVHRRYKSLLLPYSQPHPFLDIGRHRSKLATSFPEHIARFPQLPFSVAMDSYAHSDEVRLRHPAWQVSLWSHPRF